VQIQLNTDNHLVGSPDLARRIEADLHRVLERYADRVTRIEVHLADVNSDKAGGRDKQCLMEARVAGMQPVSVSHAAPTVAEAADGASEKLLRVLEKIFAKRESSRHTALTPPDDAA